MPKKTKKTGKRPAAPTEIFVVTESAEAGLQQFGAEKKIPVEKLREHLENFTGALSTALASVETLAGQFQLSEVEIHATLSAEAGFVWVTKAGVEGGVSLKFVRR